MSLSIVTSILNSHEVVHRQIMHYAKMNLPAGVEIIFVDDNSNPPLMGYGVVKIVRTYDKRPWTWPVGRNLGSRVASGTYLFMVDIDYILTREVIIAALQFRGDRMNFVRQFGVLDEKGDLQVDKTTLLSYGLKEKYLTSTNFWKGHRNNFVMRKEVYQMLGGYNEDLVDQPYDQIDGPDSSFKRVWNKHVRAGKVKDYDGYRPTLYMFPNGRFRDMDQGQNLFHALSRGDA